MLLHGTNQPLAIGTLLTSSKKRGVRPAWGNTHPAYVYCANTEYEVTTDEYEDFVPHQQDDHNEYPEDVNTTKAQRALASAIYYGVGVASRNLDARSLSLAANANDMLQDALGEPYASGLAYMTDDDVHRVRKARTLAGLSTEGYLTEAEWDALTEEEQHAFNDKYSEPAVAPPNELRGYWVYEVEVEKGTLEADPAGHHSSDTRLRNGSLRITRAIIADGVLLSDDIPYPPTNAVIPEPTGHEAALIQELTEAFLAAQKPILVRKSKKKVLAPQRGFDAYVRSMETGRVECGVRTAKGSTCKRPTAGTLACWQHVGR